MVSRVKSCALQGIQGREIIIEIDVSNGLPAYEIVGLPDKAVMESKERVRAAIKNSGYFLAPRRTVVNLAPADLRKIGTVYDLPIALGLMAAAGILEGKKIAEQLENAMFIGELALNGEVRPINGVISMALAAQEKGFRRIFCPYDNADEAACIENLEVIGIKSLNELCGFLSGERKIAAKTATSWSSEEDTQNDFSLIRGQYAAKRAAEVAAAGGHNMLLIGPPGGGKTMLARSMPGILPDLSFEEALEITRIHSSVGRNDSKGLVRKRPFVAPHHTASSASIIGGGSMANPGEISMAHHGVLFLDEFPEFKRDVLEALRQPLEDGEVVVSRALMKARYPSRFMLIAAMNPCPCGYHGSKYKQCTCSKNRIDRYRSRLSGPLIDRIDILIPMEELKYEDFHSPNKVLAESSSEIRKRINSCREIQTKRFSNLDIYCNAHMRQAEIEKFCLLENDAKELYSQEFRRQHFNGRSNARILRLARTIADLDGSEKVGRFHIAEALQYRLMDRFWS